MLMSGQNETQAKLITDYIDDREQRLWSGTDYNELHDRSQLSMSAMFLPMSS